MVSDLTLERLRQSKRDYELQRRQTGLLLGRAWAETVAGFEHLQALASLRESGAFPSNADDLARALGMQSGKDFLCQFFVNGDEDFYLLDADFLRGFVDGSLAFWDAVNSL